MVTSISSASLAPVFRGIDGASGSVALQDNLSRCERQLGDWRACPSGKTPEGKKIIQDLQTQIRNLEARIDSSGSANTLPQRASPSVQTQSPGAVRSAGTEPLAMGKSIDIFA